MEEVDKELAKIIKDIAPETVPKLKKSLGLTLDALNGILVIPKWLLCDSVRYVMKKFAKRLESIPEDEVVTIVPEIGAEILQRLPIISSNELRDLYAELLIKSSIKSEVEKIHPRFIQLLKSLSADEVLIIKFLIENPTHIFPYVTPSFPLKIGKLKKIGQSVLWTPNKLNDDLKYLSNINMYFINLSKLGILDDEKDKFPPEQEEIYKSIELKIREFIKEGVYNLYKEECLFENIFFKRCFYQVNEFGKLFLKSLS